MKFHRRATTARTRPSQTAPSRGADGSGRAIDTLRPPSSEPKHSTNKPASKMNIVHMTLAVLAFLTPAVLAGEGAPKEQITQLYDSITAGKTEEGFSQLFAASLMAKQKEMQIKAMGTQAKGAFDFYGAPTAMEFIEEKTLSESLMKLKWLTKHKDESPCSGTLFFINAPANGSRCKSPFMTSPPKQSFETAPKAAETGCRQGSHGSLSMSCAPRTE